MACEAQFPPSTKEIAGGGYEKPASLVGIPPELVLKILSMLDVGDLVRCLQVCMHLNGIVSGSATLHYRLALVRCGMQDGHPACYMGTSSRISRLVEYQRCWDTLSWRERITMNLGFEAYRRPKRYVKLFSRHVVLTHFESPLFTLVRLPSGLRNIPALSMKTSVPEVGSGTSAVDVQQNLLISVNQMPGDPSKWRIRALTMHSGELHPKAQPRYSLVVEVAALDDVPAVVQHMRIHIQGMHAALQVHNVGVIWDWRTNQLTMASLEHLDGHQSLTSATS
ncbi:hypothetical protein OF83DRAFT_457543 [Amylostereum chailletii]|nr:hypothetical protein OF83DRAFT_457543 [Amylostereum chailletii]